MVILIQILVGIVTGVGALLGSLLGLGGGFLIVPMLTIFLGVPIRTAVALSLLSILANSISASIVYVDKKVVDYRLGLILESTTMLGAVVGANINLMASESIIYVVFGIVLTYVAYRMVLGRKYDDEGGSRRRGNLYIAASVSFVAGVLSGLLGIGGGILKMPILILLLSLPTRVAIGTSLFMISITSATSTYIYFINNVINLSYAPYAVLGASIGAQLGSRLGLRIEARYLRILFSVFLLIFSLIMIGRGIGL